MIRGLNTAAVNPSYLTDLLTDQGENPEVEQELQRCWSVRGRGLEVHKQNIGEQAEEEEVHEDVPQEGGDRSKPELSPPRHQKRPPGLGR